jgi:MFS transporter, ACS family, tartrate transporter
MPLAGDSLIPAASWGMLPSNFRWGSSIPMSANVIEIAGTSVSAELEKRTLQKLRTRIIPFLFLLYIVAFLDRINIGFAALTMNKALGISAQQFGMLAGIFFFGYVIFEIPSNLLMHKIGARVWIARILVTWGIVAMLSGFAHSVTQLYMLRFLLGVAEAGFFPGMILYLTYWFRQREQAHAVALFMTALAVSSILGAPVSGFILDHVNWYGLSSWRWLLILEAIPAVICGVLTYFLLPNRPADAKFLTQEEKDWITSELAREEQQKRQKHNISALRALAHGRVWHLAIIYFTIALALYAVGFWMPQIIKSLSTRYSNTLVGLLTVIPYLAGLLTMVAVSRHSDRTHERRYHTAVSLSVGAVALFLLATSSSPLISIVLLALVTVGIYCSVGPFWALPSQFLTGFSAASGIALINSVGNLGGFVGPYAIGVISRYTGSMRGGLTVSAVSLLLGALLVLLIPKEAPARRAD